MQDLLFIFSITVGKLRSNLATCLKLRSSVEGHPSILIDAEPCLYDLTLEVIERGTAHQELLLAQIVAP